MVGIKTKRKEGININNYSDSQKQPYPIEENDKDIINNIKNKNIYNNKTNNTKKYKPNYVGRDYTNFDLTKLYAMQMLLHKKYSKSIFYGRGVGHSPAILTLFEAIG